MRRDLEQAELSFKDFLTVLPESKIREQTLSQLDEVNRKPEDGSVSEMQAKFAIAIMADLYDPISSGQANQQRIATAFEAIAYEFYERSKTITALTSK